MPELLWSFDLDGVLAEPPFGWNPAINRDVQLQPDSQGEQPPPRQPDLTDRILTQTWYRLRYALRPPRPSALDAVHAAAQRGRVIVLTGRHERGRRPTEAWLDRHGFLALLDMVVMNASSLQSARYKESYLAASAWAGRPPTLHIDDDAATCALLARNQIRAALVSWPRNLDLDYPLGVVRCDDMDAVRQEILRLDNSA